MNNPTEPTVTGVDYAAPGTESFSAPVSAKALHEALRRVPTIELVSVNGRALEDTAPQPEAKPSKLPPGIDLTKKLILNSKQLNGKMGRKAGRAQLKELRKEQMKHLKEIGYFKTKDGMGR